MGIQIRVFVRAAFALAIIAASSAAFGGTVTWSGGGGDENWTTATNWNPNLVPGPFDDVIIANAGTGIARIINVDPTVKSIIVHNGAELRIQSGRLLTVTNASSVQSGGLLHLAGGNYSGNSSLMVSGEIAVNDSTLGGSGAVLIQTGGIMSIGSTGGSPVISCNITNNGTITFVNSSTKDTTFDGATLNNSGTIDFQNNFDLNHSAGSPILNNNSGGVIVKSSGSGTTEINVTVNNAAGATIQTQTGEMELNGGGTISGTYSIFSTHFIRLRAGTYTMSGTPTISGPGGTLRLDGATLAARAGVNVTIPNLTLGSGTITGAGDVAVSGTFDWSGGTISGAGARVMNNTSTPSIICNTVNCLLDGATLQLQASTTYHATGGGALVFSNNASLTIASGKTLDFTNSSDFLSGVGGGSITNHGTISKSSFAGISTIGVPLTMFGTTMLSISAGTLQFGAGANIAAGAAINIGLGQTLEVTGGVFQFNSVGITMPPPGSCGDFKISAGTLRVLGATTIPNVTLQGGIIDGGGDLHVSGNFVWDGGTIAGDGAKVLDSTSTPTFSCSTGNCVLDGAALQVQANTIYSASSNLLVLSNGAALIMDPGKGFHITNDGDVMDGGGAASSIVIGGFASGFNASIWKTTTSGTSTIGVPVMLSGDFNVDDGTLELAAGVTVGANSIIDYDPGTAIAVSGGVFLFTSSAVSFPLNGDFIVTGGTLRLATGVTLAIPNVMLQGSGVIDGGGTLILSGTANWLGGTMGSATAPGGITRIDSGNGLNITPVVAASLTQTRQVLNNGTLAYGSLGANILTMSGSSKITNNGSFNFNDGTIGLSGSALIENFGSMTKVAGTGTTAINPPVNNNSGGTVSVPAGTIALGGGGIAAGIWSISSGATLALAGGTFNVASTATVTGPGALSVAGGTLDAGVGADLTYPNVALSAGTITGAGTLRMSGDFVFSGGTIAGSGMLFINSGATMEIGPASVVPVITRSVTNAGTITLLSTCTVDVTFDGAALTNTGTIDIQNGHNILAGIGSPIVNNNSGGVIRKSISSGITVIDFPVNNAAGATIESQNGHFYLNGGGTVSGVYSILSGSQIRLGPAAHTFTMSGTPTVTGAGTFAIVGATLDAGAGVDVTIPNLLLSSGTITGSGAVRVSGTFTWSGGTIAGSGPRVLNSTSTPTILCNIGIDCVIDGAALQLQASMTYSPSTNAVVFTNGASMTIDAGKTLSFTNSGDFLSGFGGGSIVNNGTISKITNAGISTIGVPLNNNSGGTLSVIAGTMKFAGGASIDANATIDIAATGELAVTGGVFLFNSGSVPMPGSGTFSVRAGTLRVPSGITMTIPKLTLEGSGVLDGAGTLVLSGLSLWDSGSMGSAAAPGGITQINSGSTLNMQNFGLSQTLTQGRELRNSGTVNYFGGGSPLTMSAAGKITNNATFNVASNVNINLSGSATIDNIGTLIKNSGTGTSTLFPAVNNAGTVSATTGTLALAGGGTNTGSFNVTAPANLSFSGGTHSLGGGGSIAGTGTLTFSGATATVGIPVNVSTLSVTAGTAMIDATGSADAFTMTGGSFGGSGTFTLNNGGTWSGGTMSGSGTTINPVTKSFTISAPVTLNSTLQSNGTLNVNDNMAGSGTIANNGTLNTGANVTIIPAVNNSGQVATSGILSLAGGGTNSGTISVTSPGNLSLSSGTLAVSGGSIAGTGTLTFNGATATIGVPINVATLNVSAGTATLNANASADAFTMSGGTIGGSGTLTLNNGGTWSGGTMSGSGTTNNPASKTFNISAPVTINGRTLQNNGTLNVNGAVIGGTGTIANSGTINDTADATISAPMNNSGQVTASAHLSLAGNGTHSGTFTTTNPASVIDFSGGVQTISGPFAGTGIFRFSGGTATVNNAWSGKAIDVAGGSVAFNTSGTLPALNLSGGTLTGSGALTVTGASTWSGGTISGSGPLTFDAGATVTMPGTSAATLSRPLLNQGIINFTAASSAMLIDGVPITNSGTVDIQAATQNILVTPGTPPFINNGTLKKSSGAGAVQFALPLANSGLVQIGAGTLNFSGTYAQSAGTTEVLPNGTLQTGMLSLNGGSLIGNGTVAGIVDNHAIVAPGASPGTLTINGDYVQASNGTLNIQIAGTAPGTQYDQLLVSGSVTLAGTLNVTPLSGFVPAAGNAFHILTYGAHPNSTTFTTTNGLNYGSGTVLVPTYGASDLQLITNSLQADLAVSVSAPSSVSNGSAFAYTISITNQGGSDATAVTFNALLPPNVTFNGASPAICSGAPNLVCTIGAMANQSTTVVVLGVSANSNGAAPIIVSVAGNEFDPNTANNSTSATPSISNAADLRSAVTGTPSTVAGSHTIYTIVVTNSGPDVANNVVVSAAASAGLTFSANGGACTGSFPCNLGALSSGQSVTINSAWDISPSATVSVQLTVNALSSTNDPDSSNNGAAATTIIGTCPAIVISAPHELTSGASAAATASATVALAAGAIYNWSISDGTIDSGNGTDTITFTTGDAGTVTIAVNITGASCTLSTAALLTVKPRLACQGTAAPSVPAGETTTADAVVHFGWTKVDGASGYRLWLQQGDAPAQSLGRTTDTLLTKVIPPGAHHWYVETLFEGCASHESEHPALTILPAQDCDTHGKPQLTVPANDAATTSATVAFSWGAVPKAIEYELWLATSGGVPTLIRVTSDTSHTTDVPPGGLEWYVRAIFGGCAATESAHQTFTYTPPPECSNQRPLLIAPAEDERLTSPLSFEWREVPGAKSYELSIDGVLAATTTSSRASGINVPLGERRWRVRARLAEACGGLDSTESRLVVIAPSPSCTPLEPPVLTAPGQISSGVTGRIQWTFVGGATAYVVQISTDPQFSRASTTSSTVAARELPITFTNESNVPAARYVRVYAIDTQCVVPGTGPFSPVAVISVLPPTGSDGVASLTDPTDVPYTLTIAAELAGMSFTAVPTVPWLTVTPSSGIVPSGGLTLHALAHTAGLPPGASTGTVAITTAAASGTRAALDDTSSTSTVITLNNDSSVTTQAKDTPPPDALTIPAVAKVKGIIVRYESDLYLTNTSVSTMKYRLFFVPTGSAGITQGQKTDIDIAPGATTLIRDVVGSWFGGQTSSGTLEIRPLTEIATSTSSAPASGLADRITFASSRTFSVSNGASYGQYIPTVPYANFASMGSIISLQQVAQSAKFRTNLGLVEGSGKPATVEVSIFDSSGATRASFSQVLAGGEHKQLNDVLKTHGITALDDGRIEVKVIEGAGKVTAYASVLGSDINDPLYVPPVNVADAGHSNWVVPSVVAGRIDGSGNWQTDVRIFNAENDPVELTLLFYSMNGGEAKSATATLAAGKVLTLNSVLKTFFGISQDGGALHVTSAAPARLVVTANTYNDTGKGSYGQFIPAGTPEEAVSAGSRPLQILQVEQSDQYHSNVGFAEVSGKPVTLEVSVRTPIEADHVIKVVELAANEFRQFDSLLPKNTFDARISVRAIAGEGRAIAYVSLVDQNSKDPTYIPGQ